MSSCKKNCLCNRCKPYGVVPVSKVLKGIDVCQIPKCDCSGSVSLQTPDVKFIATICPNCILQGSSVSTTFLGVSFNSTFVNLPQCISTDSGTILNVTGFGSLVFGPSIVQGTFMLQLFENLVGDDRLNFSASGLDENGNTFSMSTSQTVADEDLVIIFCNSCHLSFRKKTNKISKSNRILEELNKGNVTIIKNGQIEVKEL